MKVQTLFSLIASLLAGGSYLFLVEVARAETKIVKSGNIQAEFSSQQTSQFCGQNPRLILSRNGVSVLDQTLETEVGFCRLSKLEIQDLDGDKEAEIIADIYSGGAHCCTSSLIYRYDRQAKQYRSIEHPWGNGGRSSAEDLDRDGSLEFISRDDRFAYRFSSYAGSLYPLQIWQYRQGTMRDVTRAYPQRIKNNAYQLWQRYAETKSEFGAGKAALAAYLADKYSLGESEDGWKRVRAVYKEKDRQAFFSDLRNFLQETGYIR